MGVYVIDYLPSARWYIGASTNIAARWTYHRSALRHDVHENPTLQDLWTRDIEGAFRFRVLEVVDDIGRLREREQNWLDRYHRLFPGFGLNLHPTAGSSAGYSPSIETRAKISAANRGRKHRPETRAKISAAHMGKAAGRTTFGLEHRSLTMTQAMKVKSRLADGAYAAQVAKETGIPSYTVGRIARGMIYADVLPELNAVIAENRADGRRHHAATPTASRR